MQSLQKYRLFVSVYRQAGKVIQMSHGVCCFAARIEQIEAAVVRGQRPDLKKIEGPDQLVAFATKWIAKCWIGVPAQRPTFGGENYTPRSVFI